MVKRTRWITLLALFGMVGLGVFAWASAATTKAPAPAASAAGAALDKPNPLKAPGEGSIPVAILLSEGAQVIDFAGPWEVFQDTYIAGRKDPPFQLYTVAESTQPIRASNGLKIVPDYSLQNAPAPKVIVIPAQGGRSEAMLSWIRKSSKTADVTMSVCTGAFLLARTGLLSGKAATTHHSSYSELAAGFPDIQVRRGARYVEMGNLATAGGLSSGIDLALRVVERYFGTQVATETAYQMEYLGDGWKNPASNQVYAVQRASTPEHPLCPVCQMEVDPSSGGTLKSVYKNSPYYFCSQEHKALFEKSPGSFLTPAR
ncbi:MAG TPA: DJ-1/PfpI family protein [Candidatus Polarisedimenticolia bacterium]|nr:DJ-1/PfpI family protein [Candidatus Polarisedimenticolia bacterium]